VDVGTEEFADANFSFSVFYLERQEVRVGLSYCTDAQLRALLVQNGELTQVIIDELKERLWQQHVRGV
jgi:hypothetical protein